MGVMFSGPLLAKVLYFTTSLSNVGWNRFQNIYYLQNGITPMQIGELKSLGLALKFVGEPFWCLVADFTDPKIVYALVLFTQIFSMELIRNLHPTYNLIMIVKVIRTATAPINTLTTIAALKLIEKTNEGYGQQRMFGSLAWGIGAVSVGMLIDHFGYGSMFFFTYFFQSIALAIVLRYLPSRPTHSFLWNTNSSAMSLSQAKHKSDDKLPSALTTEEKEAADPLLVKVGESAGDDEEGDQSKDTNQDLSSVGNPSFLWLLMRKLKSSGQEFYDFFSNRACRLLLTNALLYGIIMSVVETYLVLAIEMEYHANRTYSGSCTLMATLGCIPVYYFGKRLITAYKHSSLILFAMAVLVIRLVLQGVLQPNYWGHTYTLELLLLVQVLHGGCYGLFWIVCVDAIYQLSPKHLRTSCMATLNCFYSVAGFAIGSLLWGFVYDYCGGMTYKFYMCAIVALLVVIRYFYDRKEWLDEALAHSTREGEMVELKGGESKGEQLASPAK